MLQSIHGVARGSGSLTLADSSRRRGMK
jgi:hypothetical protein